VQPFPTVPLLFIYQPNTIDNAIALPGDVLLLSSVAISVDPPPTLILIDEYAVKIPTVLTPVAESHPWKNQRQMYHPYLQYHQLVTLT
jgi:hypothetical protein